MRISRQYNEFNTCFDRASHLVVDAEESPVSHEKPWDNHFLVAGSPRCNNPHFNCCSDSKQCYTPRDPFQNSRGWPAGPQHGALPAGAGPR